MKLNSKFQLLSMALLLGIGFLWAGCKNQQPSAAAVASTTVDQYSLMNFTSADVGLVPNTSFKNINSMVNTHLYTTSAESAVSSGSALVKASGYGMTPVTVVSGPVPYTLPYMYPSPTPSYNPEGHPFLANTLLNIPVTWTPGVTPVPTPNSVVWPGYYEYWIVQTGLPNSWDQYGVSIVGLINDPENAAYPPGPGNPDPIEFEYFPYYTAPAGGNGVQGAYDLSPFQGIEFYVYIDESDSAVDRVLDVNTLQAQPANQTPAGVCDDTTSWPNLAHCYAPFYYDFTNTPKGQWVLIQKPWGSFTQPPYGSVQNPPTLSGTNLKQFISFIWAENNGSEAGPVTVNFSLAGMRFY